MNTIEIVQSFEPDDLFNLIWSEKSDTIARILLCMKLLNAVEVFNKLTVSAQISVIEYIAKIKEISPQELSIIDELLTKKPSVSTYENGLAKGGIETAVEFLNLSYNDNFSKIIDTFEEIKPELADEILKRMAVFEDIVMLSRDFLQKAFSEVSNHDLAIALKGVDKEIQEYIFRNIAKERIKIIKKDMLEMGPMLEKDVDEVKYKIVKFIRKLRREEEKKRPEQP